MNTPLSTLIASAELALRKERDAGALRDVLGSNLEELHRMSDMVRDMLFLAQAEQGAVARRLQVDSVAQLASSVLDYHDAALAESGLTTRIMGDGKGNFDVPLLKRALSNLLSNATRYAKRGTTVEVRIERESDDKLSISVINAGKTIPSQLLPHVFERFFRADLSRSQSQSGEITHHGLGLSIVSAIARMHGGRAYASSENGVTNVGIIVPHVSE